MCQLRVFHKWVRWKMWEISVVSVPQHTCRHSGSWASSCFKATRTFEDSCISWQEDYFDESTGTWDMEGLEDDLRLAKDRDMDRAPMVTGTVFGVSNTSTWQRWKKLLHCLSLYKFTIGHTSTLQVHWFFDIPRAGTRTCNGSFTHPKWGVERVIHVQLNWNRTELTLK